MAFWNKISDTLDRLDLSVTDVLEILDDSGITLGELLEVYNYLNSAPEETPEGADSPLIDKEAFSELLNTYEQKLGDWLKLAGYELDLDFLNK